MIDEKEKKAEMQIQDVLRRMSTKAQIKKQMFLRNQYSIKGIKSRHKIVNVEYYPLLNIGDTLGPIIVDWFLKKKNIDPDIKVSKTKHLMTVGSIIGFGSFDSTIWGSGILNKSIAKRLQVYSSIYHLKYDIRAVRGPLTRNVLQSTGFICPETFGDPAVLLPLIYNNHTKKKYNISVILHYRTQYSEDASGHYKIHIAPDIIDKYQLHFIDPKTRDYKYFIDEIISSEYIISSSLHGIIIAETYGIPATFLNWGMDDQTFKYVDWYLSTGRAFKFYTGIEEAIENKETSVPELSLMKNKLMDCFPYDLWDG